MEAAKVLWLRSTGASGVFGGVRRSNSGVRMVGRPAAGTCVTPKSGRRIFSMLKGSARGLAAEGDGERGTLDSSGDLGEGGGGLRPSCVGGGGLRASCEGGVGGNAGLTGAGAPIMTATGKSGVGLAIVATCC